jgi:small GTP-binding protein
MIQKKICMLGTSAVGKTSLVSKYVYSIFSEKYQTTLGVKIDNMIVSLENSEVKLMIWDLAGVDEFQSLRGTYLRGSGGYLLVADGTRNGTLDSAVEIQSTVVEAIGSVPFVLAMNKVDLRSEWEVPDVRIANLSPRAGVSFQQVPRPAKGSEVHSKN